MKSGKDGNRKKGRSYSASVELEYKRKNTGNATNPTPQPDIRLDRVAHFFAFSDKRAACKLPGCSGKIYAHCIKCDVHLCLSKKQKLLLYISYLVICFQLCSIVIALRFRYVGLCSLISAFV